MKTSFRGGLLVLLIVGIASLPLPCSASIIGISIPENSQDAACYPINENIWSVSAPPYPLSVAGIGHIIVPGGEWFSLHDHVYVADYIPDPTRAVVTYQFDVPTVVKGLEIIQHSNGITKIEGFYGNSLSALHSLGAVFGPSGDITGDQRFYDGQDEVFDLGNTTLAGTYFQFIIRKTSLDWGFGNPNSIPLDVNGNRILGATAPVPLPGAVWLLGSGLGLLGWVRRRLQG